MKLKKFLTVVLSLLIFAGCTVGKYQLTSDEATKSSKNVKINLVIKEGQALFMEEASKKYNEENPNIVVNIIRLEDSENYNEQLISLIHSDEVPTAFSIDGEYELDYWKDDIQLINQDWIEEAPEMITEPVNSSEKYYAFPIEVYGSGVIYNKNLLEYMEIDYSNIGNISGLKEVVSQINQRMNETTLEAAVCQYEDFADLLASSSLDINNTSTFNIDSDFSELINLCGKNVGDMDSADMLANQKAAIYIGSSNIIKEIYYINTEIARSLIISPLEINGAYNYIISSSYLAIYQNADTIQKNTVTDFLKWLYFSADDILTEYNAISPYSCTTVTEVGAEIYKSINENRNSDLTRGIYAPTGWRTYFDEKITEYCSKSISWDDFCDKITTQWSKLYRN